MTFSFPQKQMDPLPQLDSDASVSGFALLFGENRKAQERTGGILKGGLETSQLPRLWTTVLKILRRRKTLRRAASPRTLPHHSTAFHRLSWIWSAKCRKTGFSQAEASA